MLRLGCTTLVGSSVGTLSHSNSGRAVLSCLTLQGVHLDSTVNFYGWLMLTCTSPYNKS